jgi:N-acetylmuramoyl-L-alanine amidase
MACAVFAILGASQPTPMTPAAVHAAATPAASAAPHTAAPVAVKTLPPPTKAPAKAAAKVDLSRMGALTLRHTMAIRSAPSHKAPAHSMVGPNITLPIEGFHGTWVHLMTPCEISGWVPISETNLIPAGEPTSDLKNAVFVIDPGHGGSESGAIGPDGVQEQTVNLAIARKLAADLKGSRVYLTRTGHYNVGLRFRGLLASKLHASAFLSMHNNSGPVKPSLRPGTQTWHQVRSTASTQLAGILWHNLFSALSRFKVRWVSAVKVGPQARPGDHGYDYYAVLRNSTAPAVIVESLFINNRAEELLLRNSMVQNAIAAATAQSAKTFVTSGDAANAAPYTVKGDKSGGLPRNCRDPY